MKKIGTLVVCFAVTLSLAGCGVSQEQHTILQDEYTALQELHTVLQGEYAALQKEHTELIEETADWIILSEEEKATECLNAEANRIAAEEALKKEREAQAAAEKQAAEEETRRVAEEAAQKVQEEKKGYETGITYDMLSRNPEKYINEKVKFKGEVLQVTEVDEQIQIRIATKAASWGGYSGNNIYVYFDSTLISSRLLEKDIITLYGTSKNLYTYETVLGASVTIPLIEVDKIDLH